MTSNILKHGFLLLGAAVMAFPFYWMLTTSFKSFVEAQSYPPTFWPAVWHFENWAEAWNFPNTRWPRSFANTIFVATVVTLGTIVSAVLAAYAFARMQFRGRGLLFSIFLLTIFIPNEATLIPNFVLMSRRYLGWYDTYTAQIVPFLASVFSIFLLRQFFLGVPREIEEAAILDGANTFQIYWQIMLPLVKPALLAIGVLSFQGNWNNFEGPLIYLNTLEKYPMVLGLQFFGESLSREAPKYHYMMAMSTLMAAPILALFFFAQRYFIEGLTVGAVKG